MFKGKVNFWKWAFITFSLMVCSYFTFSFGISFLGRFVVISQTIALVLILVFFITSILGSQLILARYFIKRRLNFDELWMLAIRTSIFLSVLYGISNLYSGDYPNSPNILFNIIRSILFLIIAAGVTTIILVLFLMIVNTIMKKKYDSIDKFNQEDLVDQSSE